MVLINYPHSLNVFLTKSCNLKCSYCFVNKEREKAELKADFFKKGIDIFLRFPSLNKTISFNGGEPLLRFGKVKELCQYSWHKNNGKAKLTVAVMTNGTLLSESRYRFLKKNKIVLKISIDGKKNTHDFNRPFKQGKHGSSYERIINNVRRLREDNSAGYKICASLVFTPDTVGELLRNTKSLWKAGFDYVDFYPELYARWSPRKLEKTESIFTGFADFYPSIFNNATETKDIFENSLLHTFTQETELYKPVCCQKVHLGWEGNFYCCDKVFSLPFPERKKFIVGNIKKGINNRLRLSLLEKKRKEIRELTGKDCSTCKYLKYCFCPVGHYIYFSSKGLDFKEYFPQFCRISQIYISNFLKIKTRLKTNRLFAETYLNNA